MKNGIILLLATCFLALHGRTQDTDPDAVDHFNQSTITDINPMHSFTIEIGLPVILANKFNQRYMDGMLYFSPYYQYTFDSHLALGAGVFFNYTRIKSTAIAETVFGGNSTLGAFFKVSHEKFHSTRFATDIGVKMGAAQAFYKSNKLTLKGERSTDLGVYIEPNIGFILTVAEKSSFRFMLGYNMTAIPFSNHTIAMESDGGMSGKDFRKLQQYLTIGFGYTFYAKTRR